MVPGDAAVIKGNWLSEGVSGHVRLNHLIGIQEDKVHCGPARPGCGDNCCCPCSSVLMFFCEMVCEEGLSHQLDLYITVYSNVHINVFNDINICVFIFLHSSDYI